MRVARSNGPSLAVTALLLVYLVLVYRTAWISDDAYITLRTVSNALSGNGLRWNVAERVQTFTHPLWMFWLMGAHAVSGEPFYSTLYLSWIVSCAAVAILFIGTKGGAFERMLALVLLIFSKAFVEFSTSGLENPLTHLWLACFAVLYLRRGKPAGSLPLSALAGLAVLTRFDTVLLYAPALLARLRGRPRAEQVSAAFVAASPVAAWLVFSVIYYGFPWPNTAYAKLGIGELAGRHRLTEALHYFEKPLRVDPLTLVAWLAIVVLMLRRRDVPRLALLAGSALSLCYVLAIGGDFMGGRFFSAPFFLAVACLASSDGELLASKPLRLGALGLTAALIALGGRPSLLTDASYGGDRPINEYGVHDARAEFFQHSSLLNASKMSPARHDHPWSRSGHVLRERVLRDPTARVQLIDAIGFVGYYSGPQVHIVDRWALADPLLARLPAAFGAVGHYTRVIPDGYMETLASGMMVMHDPTLATYYSQLSFITRGELFTAARWRAIWAFNTGAWDKRLREASYVETKSLTARARITNLSDRPEVIAYVWNDGRQTAYVLDEHSHKGQSYEVTWRVTSQGPELLAPLSARMTERFESLSESGMFTVSAAFRSSPKPGDTDIYELQYHYKRKGPVITMLRSPLPMMALNFPLDRFQARPVFEAIQVLEARHD